MCRWSVGPCDAHVLYCNASNETLKGLICLESSTVWLRHNTCWWSCVAVALQVHCPAFGTSFVPGFLLSIEINSFLMFTSFKGFTILLIQDLRPPRYRYHCNYVQFGETIYHEKTTPEKDSYSMPLNVSQSCSVGLFTASLAHSVTHKKGIQLEFSQLQ